jgi:hypothetical protein
MPRLAGPNVYWFAWPHEHYRDLSALVMSRWLMEGRRDTGRWLNRWRPEILVLTVSWKKMLFGEEPVDALIARQVPCRVQFLGTVDPGPGDPLGPLEIYRLQWLPA